MTKAIFLNGVFESVLEEILAAQANNPGGVFYLQPYANQRIKQLAENPPSESSPISLYISTTQNLDKICYMAKIVGWEDKRTISEERKVEVHEYIKQHQPDETGFYSQTEDGKPCVNLISIRQLKKLPNQYSVTNLKKVNDDSPLGLRTRAGGWSYVYELDWLGHDHTYVKEDLDEELERSVKASANIDDEARRMRLLTAPKKPEAVQIISRGFRRNPDVIVEVLKRAGGKCEQCGKDAPFLRASDGSPYLEIHHWIPLSEGGDDAVENAGALCPNCHRKVHYGQNKQL
jgi:5-methylcytosine-specific restriction enzyme A